jgi:hypothetical protein
MRPIKQNYKKTINKSLRSIADAVLARLWEIHFLDSFSNAPSVKATFPE